MKMEEHFTEFKHDLRGLHQFQSLLTQFYMNYLILHITLTNFEKQWGGATAIFINWLHLTILLKEILGKALLNQVQLPKILSITWQDFGTKI